MIVLSRKSLIASFGTIFLVPLAAGCFSTTDPEAGGLLAAQASDLTARCVTPEDAGRMADQVLQLLNLERAERDLQPVVVNRLLTKIAETYSCRLVEGKFFGHRDPINGYGPADRAITGKYTFYAVGENLAAGPDSASGVMKVWMESPSHRRIILDPIWQDVGIAVRAGGEHSIYWVLELGDPAGF